MINIRCLLILVGTIVLPGFCRADLILMVGNGELEDGTELRNPFVSVEQGNSGSIRFSASADGEGFDLDGYNLYLDVGGDGFGLPSGVTFTGSTPVAGGFNDDGDVGFNDANGPLANMVTGGLGNYDFIVEDSRGTGLALSDGDSTNLFDLNFTASASAAPGVYDVLFVASPVLAPGASGFQTTPNARPLQVFNGSFEITATAVPEPSSILMAASGLGAVGLQRWRRRRKRLGTVQVADGA